MEKSDMTFHIHGGNVQVLPNAAAAIQNNFGGVSDSGSDAPTPLDPYIHDRGERQNFIRRITQCPDAVTLCKTVLADLYNDVLADFEGSKELIRSKTFVEGILPLLMFDSGKSVKNIQALIRKYVFGEI
ncbi:hypothetical protein [Odoribacter lunatus]|uniref:hypothetical protein n=1 Tax=Odoribacter lunatus TaxID=2941335 RepID=UPI00204249D4|nr:hypothetical protein [Odoribacter lunatus]